MSKSKKKSDVTNSSIKKKTPIVFDLNAKNGKIPWNADGSYPYSTKIDVLDYEQQKHELQIELLKMQSWVKDTKQVYLKMPINLKQMRQRFQMA